MPLHSPNHKHWCLPFNHLLSHKKSGVRILLVSMFCTQNSLPINRLWTLDTLQIDLVGCCKFYSSSSTCPCLCLSTFCKGFGDFNDCILGQIEGRLIDFLCWSMRATPLSSWWNWPVSCLTGGTWAGVASRQSLATIWSVCIAWLRCVWSEYSHLHWLVILESMLVCLALSLAHCAQLGPPGDLFVVLGPMFFCFQFCYATKIQSLNILLL